ncbi:MAG: trehalose-phosphatase [Alphaproteobacteria bacterium]
MDKAMVEATERIRDIVPLPWQPASGRSLEVASDWALFLDVDGTLLPIAETPDAVTVSAQLCKALRDAVPALGGAVALISGRPIAALDDLFAPLRLPAAGLHGLERRDSSGTLHKITGDSGVDDLREPLRAFAAAHPGVLLEDKGPALALHYRRAPAAAEAARQLVADLTAAMPGRMRVLSGKMVIEIAPSLADKGMAIAAFMDEAPFAGRRPVFIGDDVTDEDGFAMVNSLGGYSIRVGEAETSAAAYQFPEISSVVDWLQALPTLLRSPQAGGQG